VVLLLNNLFLLLFTDSGITGLLLSRRPEQQCRFN